MADEKPTKLKKADFADMHLYIEPQLYKDIKLIKILHPEALDGKSISAYFSEMVEGRIREIKSSTPIDMGN